LSKEFNAAVREQFNAALTERAPQFEPAKADARFSWPGERAYVWRANEALWCWVSLIPSAKGYNEFSLELGWSDQARFPALQSRPSIAANATAPRDLDASEFMCNLSSISDGPAFWQAHPNIEDGASESERFSAQSAATLAVLSKEEAASIVRPLVRAAVDDLVKFGLPYLSSIVSERGSR
jgi:hypothetical protein